MAAKLEAVSLLHYLLLVLCFSSITTVVAAMKQEAEAMHLHLTHHDSPSSLFYNPNATPLERAERAIARSMSRFAYLNGMTRSSLSTTHDIQADLLVGAGAYYVKLRIGTPSFQILLFMDTASDLTWTQCLPCEQCYDQQSPIFDPSKSQTYTNISCHSDYYCPDLTDSHCDEQGTCNYAYIYADQTITSGALATEAFTFDTNKGDPYVFTDIVFGCGHKNQFASAGEIAGILGLGHRNRLSMIAQAQSRFYIEPKFSYCLTDQTDNSITSHLVLGAFLGIKATLLEIVDGRYTVYLKDISVGATKLNLPPGTFNKSSEPGSGGMMIDSGGTLTFLAEKGYDRFVEELERQLHLSVDAPAVGSLRRCYSGTMDHKLNMYEGVTFHFAGDMDMLLYPKNLFLEVGWRFCLAVLPAPPEHASVLGNMAQQYYSVGYDLERSLVSFTRTECSNF